TRPPSLASHGESRCPLAFRRPLAQGGRERTNIMATNWTPEGWTGYEARQLPDYADKAALDRATAELAHYPPLVFAGEARALTADLAQVAAGKAFLLQGGDCAES